MPALPLLAYKLNGATKVVGAIHIDRPRTLHLHGEKIEHLLKGSFLVIEQAGTIYHMSADAMLANYTASPADQATIDAVVLGGLSLHDTLTKKYLV